MITPALSYTDLTALSPCTDSLHRVAKPEDYPLPEPQKAKEAA